MNSNPFVTLRRYRDFRRLWLSAVVSDVGTWMQAVTVTVLVATTSQSAASTALVYSALFLPQAVCAPLGGLLADRFDRRHVAIAVQAVQAVLAAALAVMVGQGITSPYALAAMVALLGCANAAGQPAYAAMIPLLVPRSDLYPAVSLNAVSWNTGRILGPILAAVTVQLWGASATIAINAVSFLAMAAVMLTIHRPLAGGGHVDLRQVRHELATAAKLMWSTPSLRLMLCTVALMQACFAAMFSLVPLYAETVSDSDHLAQMVYSALGLGALIGALCSSGLARRLGRSRVLVTLLLGGASAMVLASQMTTAAGAIACAFLFGLCATPAFVLVGGVVQRDAPEQFRGRITSIHVAVVGLVFGIAAPLGGFLADEVWGLRTHLALSGLIIGAAVVATALSRADLADLVDGTDVPLVRAEQATTPA